MPSQRGAAWAQRLAAFTLTLMRCVSRHWLLLANGALLLFAGLPILAPAAMHAGHTRLGEAIHALYFVTCHQLPERSFFLYGPSAVYTRPELVSIVGTDIPVRFIGSAAVGYKMAVCQRCIAVYGSWFVWGLLFGLVRRRLRPLPLRAALALLVPMAVDGGGQLIGLWDSTWVTRVVTGALFGLAVVWLTYPYIEGGMQEMRAEAEDLSHRGGHA